MIQVMLNAAIPHHARICLGADGLDVVSTGGAWDYAVSFSLPPMDFATGNLMLRLGMSVRLRSGSVGLGIVAADGSTYLGETRLGPDEDADGELLLPVERLSPGLRIVLRNTGDGIVDLVLRELRLDLVDTPPMASLHEVTQRPFTPRAHPERPFRLAAINTTEVCNLSCVMCHFNGPHATIKARSLSPVQVEHVLDQIPAGTQVLFSGTGDILMDENALDHMRAAVRRGLEPAILTNGQKLTAAVIETLLAIGVRFIRMSVDSTRPEQYRKIRRGGELETVLEACRILRRFKAERYPDLRVEINCILFRSTQSHQAEMVAFWKGLVDQVNFNAEYYDTFRFRNTFWIPTRRNDCDLQLYVMPSGRISPCCAVTVKQHEQDLEWLPHIDDVSLENAYKILSDFYQDKTSPLAAICRDCDWWISFTPADADGTTPYLKLVDPNGTDGS